MPAVGDVHVVPDDHHWMVSVEGGGPRIRYRSQDEAIRGARAIAAANGTALWIHRTDGQIRKWES